MRYTRADLFFIMLGAVMASMGWLVFFFEGIIWHALFFTACLAAMIVGPWLEQRRMSRPERVTFDEQRIERHMPNGTIESISWEEIDEVGILTTDEGPFVDDVFWLMTNSTRTKGCAPSNAAEGFSSLLERLQTLPGFNNEAVIRAMGSTDGAYFLVWRREER